MFRQLRSSIASLRREHQYALVVVLLAGLAVWLLATQLFPYHSSNDDEAVYLLQAAMLLEGQLELHAGDLVDAFRPWFFIEDGSRLYPKYTPVPAAMYAVSMALFGEPRVTLAAVAAGNAALIYVLGSMAVDRRVGVVAAVVFAASPLALVTTSVFLPYAPTTLLNLAFAVCYLRGVRSGRLRDAGLAGVAVGLAFFARPYTAVLFAAPFIGHALWTVLRAIRTRAATPDRALRPLPGAIRRNVLTAAIGLAFVGVTLAYNARLTGSPLVFPYQAFAPLDGPGFGYRQIENHAIEYTPALALETNAYVLEYFWTRWFTAGPIGTAAALAGLGVAIREWVRRGHSPRSARADGTSAETDGAGGQYTVDRTVGLLLAGVLVTVPAGNVPFWGTFNLLAGADPTTGLIAQFGPFYHFDLLVPLSIFAAVGFVTGWRRLRASVARGRLAALASPRTARALALSILVVTGLVVGVGNAALVSTPIERNAAHTERFESAYEPFEDRDLENAVVFLPTPYGQWQGHPFQALRNDPDFDGDVVYALDGPPERDFEVLEAYPERDYYRYTYRGEWTPEPGDPIVPALQPLTVRDGASFTGETVVGVADQVERAVVRLETDDAETSYEISDPDDEITVDWGLMANETGGVARLPGATNDTVAIDDADEIELSITLVQSEGATYTYREAFPVRTVDGRLEVIWPPERTGCLLVSDCGTEGTYLPDRPALYDEWEYLETRLAAEDRDPSAPAASQ
ncbi:ArnT family glycosyltransferase [Haloarchaeobius amylolyticus]|uniref:ArnT family glycosyltransferase n=1 Tax=Haloarchaeobius amylolyticus TaxID=1198296 RepID=A0ABD6BF33_9EURY